VAYVQVTSLGKLSRVDSMVITWPGGERSRYVEPGLDKEYRLDESREVREVVKQEVKAGEVMLDSVRSSFVRHREDDQVDFYYERNIPELLSREGPRAAVGDVNGDGLQDVYIGGGKGQAGQLYLQQAGGSWKLQEQKLFEEYSDFEDVAVLLFDADGDKDLDLFIGSGGNASAAGSRELQHRLYVNDGRGNFSSDVNAFESNDANIGAVVAADFDGDGDQDLFVGGRSVPQSYGSTPQSYVYLNDGKGHFKDIARTLNPELSQVGMVTGAVWSGGELVVVGEWMSPKVFKFNKNKFEEVKTNLEGMQGWWQTVMAADLDGDGREDLVLGNMGENFYLRPTAKEPVKLWLNDFDQNGTMDKILTRSIAGRDVPVFLKRELEEQLPVLKKQNLHHRDYAMRTVEDLFGKEVLQKSVEKDFTYSSSCIAWNQGQGRYEVEKLEGMAQLSSVNAVVSVDVNADGRKDLVVGGNRYGFPPQFGRLDGSYGDVLLNEGNRKFKWQWPAKTGVKVRGEVRDVKTIRGGKGEVMVMYLVNDDYPKVYRIRNQELRSKIQEPRSK
jgi:enediyne biosynthesis protein E4